MRATSPSLGILIAVTIAVSLFTLPGPSVSRGQDATKSGVAREPQGIQEGVLPRTICKVSEEFSCLNCKGLCPADPLRKSIEDFSTRIATASGTKTKQPISGKRLGVPEGRLVKHLVAIVPDPNRTHLALFFDRSIDAIEDAAQDAGYIFDRATLPWSARDHPESTDFTLRELADKYQDAREALPGLMIFRRADPRHPGEDVPLFVWVVGETPTGGIHKDQFRRALAAIRRLPSDGRSSGKPEVNILGPTFSGSLYSLQRLLSENRTDFDKIRVHSGTISSWKTSFWFTKNKPPDTAFRTFQESDEYAIRRFLQYAVYHQGYRPKDVAILSEQETAYGSFGETGANDSVACPNEWTRHEPVMCLPKQAVWLYFPRDISQLRSAYQHDLGGGESNSDKIPRSTLRLNLEDTESDQDTVPSYSRVQTPLSQEAVLLGIVTNLEKHHSQFVLIRATNPLDQLFLARYLRTAYPQGRIVTSDADLLFRREVDNALLHGIMTLTPYGLLPGSEDDTVVPKEDSQPVHVHRVFPNAYAVGTYNATLSLLKCSDLKTPCPEIAPNDLCKIADLPPAQYAEYGWPRAAGKEDRRWQALSPPLRLTVLGRYGYWNLDILDRSDDPEVGDDIVSNLHSRQGNADDSIFDHFRFYVSQPWRLVCGIGIALVLLFLFLTCCGTLDSASQAMANFAPLPSRRRDLLLAIAASLLLLMLAALILPWRTWGLSHFKGPFSTSIACFLGVLGILLPSLVMLRLKHQPSATLCLILSGVAVLIALVLFPYVLGPTSHINFLIYRYMHVTSGVSPLVPWLLLVGAAFWWIWYNLAGLALLDERRPRLPAGPKPFSALTYGGNRHLLRIALPPSLSPNVWWFPFLVVTIVVVVLDSGHPIQSLEGRAYDWLYTAALLSALFLLLCTLMAMVLTWLELRSLLIALDSLPLRRGFTSLKALSWKPIWKLRGGRLQDFMHVSDLEIEALRQWLMKCRGRGPIAEIESLQKEIRQGCARVSGAHSLKEHDTLARVRSYVSLQDLLHSACGYALVFLEQQSKEEKATVLAKNLDSDTAVEDAKKASEKSEDEQVPVETRLAERFVCLAYLNFILTIIMRLRTLALTAVGMFVFLLLSVSSYPFEPKRAIRSLLVLLFLILIGSTAVVYGQMHRDATLSRITDTKPGELGVDFWMRILGLGTVPLLSLLLSQYPEMNSFVFSWLQPALDALK